MASSRNDAELIAFMKAVVNEEYKNAFTSNLPERSDVWRTGQRNDKDHPIILQNVYYSSKEEPHQPFRYINQAEVQESNHLSKQETMVPRITSSVGMLLPQNLQDSDSDSQYYKLQESYGLDLWCNVDSCAESIHDERPKAFHHVQGGRPNTISEFRGTTGLQSKAHLGSHQLYPNSATSAHTEMRRYFKPQPNVERPISDACLRRNINEGSVVDRNNIYVLQCDCQSQFTVHKTWIKGPTSPCPFTENSVLSSAHRLLPAKTTTPRLKTQFVLESEDNQLDFQERILRQPSPAHPHSYGRECGGETFARETVSSLHNEEPIASRRFSSNPNIHGPSLNRYQHAANRTRGATRKASVLSEEELIKRACASLWRNVDSSTQEDFAADQATQMKLGSYGQGITINKHHSLFKKEVPTLLSLDNQCTEGAVTKMVSSCPVPTSNRVTCSSKQYLSPIVERSKIKENLNTGPKRLFNKRTMAPVSSKTSRNDSIVTKTQITGIPISKKYPHSLLLNSNVYKCSFVGCLKQFSKKSYLACHLRLHTGEKRYVCPWKYCGRRFRRGDERRRHYRSHTGEKPYKCPSCARPFSRSDHLKNHMRKMHSITG